MLQNSYVRLSIMAAMALLSANPAAAHAAAGDAGKDVLTLKPSSDWKLKKYEDKCRMRRNFGVGDDSVSLWIDQGSPIQSYNLTLMGRPLRHPYGTDLTVQFAPEPEYTRQYIKLKSSKDRPVIVLFGARLTPIWADRETEDQAGKQSDEDHVDLAAGEMGGSPTNASPEEIAAITELRLARALINPVTLKTGSMADPLTRLQDCAIALHEEIYNNTRLGSPPNPIETDRWIPLIQESYPSQLLHANQEGRIELIVTIGTDGRPVFCEAEVLGGQSVFNDTVCLIIMKHALFEPGKNAQGEAVVSRYTTKVTFIIDD